MNWIELSDIAQLNEIYTNSYQKTAVIFKHSTRCSVSSMVLHRLEKTAIPSDIDFYFLDLIKHRDISNMIAEKYSVYHESPQVLIIKDGECVYDESHNGIYMDDILNQL